MRINIFKIDILLLNINYHRAECKEIKLKLNPEKTKRRTPKLEYSWGRIPTFSVSYQPAI